LKFSSGRTLSPPLTGVYRQITRRFSTQIIVNLLICEFTYKRHWLSLEINSSQFQLIHKPSINLRRNFINFSYRASFPPDAFYQSAENLPETLPVSADKSLRALKLKL
jgi:hypothetical protein